MYGLLRKTHIPCENIEIQPDCFIRSYYPGSPDYLAIPQSPWLYPWPISGTQQKMVIASGTTWILWNPSSDHHRPFRLVDACNIPVIIILNVIPMHNCLALDIQAKSCITFPLKVPFTSVSITSCYLVGGFISLNLHQVLHSSQRSYFVNNRVLHHHLVSFLFLSACLGRRVSILILIWGILNFRIIESHIRLLYEAQKNPLTEILNYYNCHLKSMGNTQSDG